MDKFSSLATQLYSVAWIFIYPHVHTNKKDSMLGDTQFCTPPRPVRIPTPFRNPPQPLHNFPQPFHTRTPLRTFPHPFRGMFHLTDVDPYLPHSFRTPFPAYSISLIFRLSHLLILLSHSAYPVLVIILLFIVPPFYLLFPLCPNVDLKAALP